MEIKSSDIAYEQFQAKLLPILEEMFPKGKCQERGAALVLYAHALLYAKEVLKEND